MSTADRFLRYIKLDTQSSDRSGTTPSTQGQWALARLLADELGAMGLSATVSGACVVMARIPASPGHEHAPAIGFLAHMDTSPAFSGRHVTALVHQNYDGGDVVLPKGERTIKSADFPFLRALAGKTLITTDGATLLGADDKAGAAEIVEMCARLLSENIPHGPVCVAFTPDEEIGEGVDHFDVAAFGAEYAYTVDGGAAGSIEYENFNAAGARVRIEGVSVHPGAAKNVMENALLLAQEINALLPPGDIPARTEGYEGFFHLDRLEGTAASAVMEYIIRDHDREKFEQRKDALRRICESVAAAHPTARVTLEMRDSYYNMRQRLTGCMHLVENAKKAAALAGLTASAAPIRGGTDGARLSYMGLPCPNLGTGGYNCHGPMECVCAEDMEAVTQMLLHIVRIYSGAEGQSG